MENVHPGVVHRLLWANARELLLNEGFDRRNEEECHRG